MPKAPCAGVSDPRGKGRHTPRKAVHDAHERGAGDLPVLVLPHQAYAADDAYAIMRLSDMARLAHDAQRGRES